jgi:hypothetical protein
MSATTKIYTPGGITFDWEKVPSPVLAANPSFKYCFKIVDGTFVGDPSSLTIGLYTTNFTYTGLITTPTEPLKVSAIIYTDGTNFYFNNAIGRTIYGVFLKDNNNILQELNTTTAEGSTWLTTISYSTPTEEELAIQCFEQKLHDKTLEFNKDLANYVKKLNYGSRCCEELDRLTNEKRVLDILNCYDTRDIYECTEQDYKLSEENKRYLSTIGSEESVHAGYVQLPFVNSANITSLNISSTPYNESFVSGANSWVNANFAKWDVIRISQESTLDTVNINAGLFLIYLTPTVSNTFVSYVVRSLSNFNVSGPVNIHSGFLYSSTPEFLRVSKGGTGTTFKRKTSVNTTDGTFYVGPTIATTTFSTTTTITVNSSNAAWNNSFIVGDFVVIFENGGSSTGQYVITSTTGTTSTQLVLGVTHIVSGGTFTATVDKLWAIVRVSKSFSSTTIPPVCTQDTTNYNNLTYTEVNNLLNS